MKTVKNNIIIALSGGIDSGMAVVKLREEGWKNIFAANHVVHSGIRSSSDEVLDRARELCRRDNIPFYIIDARERFSGCVIDDFMKRYAEGLTPNPCVICNETIKFTWFYDSVVSILNEQGLVGRGEEVSFATGHYAGIKESEGKLFIRRAADRAKDQSYMLYRLPPEILSRCVFPLGDVFKKDLAFEAAEAGYSFESVKESQDICFVESNYADYIKENAPPGFPEIRPGKIVDIYGNYLGKHRGYINYTVGQRKGLSLGNGPWYVVSIDSQKNRVVVGREDDQGQDTLSVEKTNWFIDVSPGDRIECSVMLRYNSSETPCEAKILGNGQAFVKLDARCVVTPGQSAVFYSDDLVLGGGIICRN